MKDKFYSKLSFYLSLGFWIPLLNVGLSIVAFIIAIIALKKQYYEPKKYGGTGYFVVAMILSITSLILTIVGLTLYLFSDRICTSSICLAINQ